MKKTLLIFGFGVLLTAPSFAQFSRGTLFIGPSIGTNSYQSASDNLNYSAGPNAGKGSSIHTYTLTTGPQLGVFVTDHLITGGSLNYSLTDKRTDANTTLTNSNTVIANAKTTTSTFSTGPFVRYYWFQAPSKNVFYTQVNTTLGTGSGTSSGNGNRNNTSTYSSNGTISGIFTWTAGGSVGVTHFFTDVIGMDLALGYNFNSTTSTNKSTVNTTSNSTELVTSAPTNYKETVLTHGVTIGCGFHWFLRK